MSIARACAILTAAWIAATPALAQDTAPEAPAETPFVPSLPATAAGVPGTWDISRDGTRRRCVMTLTDEPGNAGRRLRFPAGCHRALPILGGVAGWLYTEAGLRLVDKDLRPILLFTRRPDQRSLLAPAQGGETYSLVPLQIAAMAPPGTAPAQPAADAAPASQGADATGAVAAVPSGGMAGVYALDRFREKDVCRLELTAGAAASAPVRIVDGCRDSGLGVFDPVSWSFAKGRLTLTARRGHTVDLVPMGEGTWRRDPETGTTFVLRKVEP